MESHRKPRFRWSKKGSTFSSPLPTSSSHDPRTRSQCRHPEAHPYQTSTTTSLLSGWATCSPATSWWFGLRGCGCSTALTTACACGGGPAPECAPFRAGRGSAPPPAAGLRRIPTKRGSPRIMPPRFDPLHPKAASFGLPGRLSSFHVAAATRTCTSTWTRPAPIAGAAFPFRGHRRGQACLSPPRGGARGTADAGG